MASSGSDRKVPIERENSSMEDHRRNMLNGLQRGCSSQDVAVRQPEHAWFNELNHWIVQSQRQMDEEIRRMRQDMFALDPFDLSVDPWGDFAGFPSMIDRMGRRMEAMRRQLQPALSGPSHGELLPRLGDTSTLLDVMNDAFEVGADGKLHFKARFNVSGFKPEEIEVTTKDQRLMVRAKHSAQSKHGFSNREFYKLIDLPKSIDPNQCRSHLTADGVLTVEAPVKNADYEAITFGDDHRLKIKPKSGSEGSKALVSTGQAGPVILKDANGGRRLHLEIPIDKEFKADDLAVRMERNRVVISGKHHSKETVGSSTSESVREFSRAVQVPETLDPFSTESQLVGDRLVIEAPLRSNAEELDAWKPAK